jgi:hypothetical protein
MGEGDDGFVLIGKGEFADLESLNACAREVRCTATIQCNGAQLTLLPDCLRGFIDVSVWARPEGRRSDLAELSVLYRILGEVFGAELVRNGRKSSGWLVALRQSSILLRHRSGILRVVALRQWSVLLRHRSGILRVVALR